MKKITLLMAGLAIGVLSFNANAAKNPHVVKAHSWTFGASVAANNATVSDLNNLTSGTHANVDKDLSGSALRVMGEYNFKRWFALGLGYDYLDSGKLKLSQGLEKVDVKIKQHVVELYGKFSTNIKGVELFAKAGPTLTYTKFSGLADDTGTQFGAVLGAGASYRFSNGIGVRAGYDFLMHTAELENKNTGKTADFDAGLAYLGVTYNFR
ncbi:MAG: outer membrane beta-barrel protein [Succinivibrio sp.]